MLQIRSLFGRSLSGRVIDGRALGARSTSSGGAPAFPSNAELREDGGFELREDGSYELREDIALIPVNSVSPVISGTANFGQTLSCTTGTWSNAPSSYAYQWKRAGVDIGSATNSTYVTVNADLGTAITCAVTATNAGGNSTPATSNTLTIFSPLDLTPVLWIDPSDTATMFQSNAGTTTVTDTSVCGYAGDKSGNAFNITSVADDTTRPTWNLNGGFPYLNFDGSNDFMRRAASLGMYAAGACSAFIAVRGNPGTGKTLIGESASAAPQPFYVMHGSDGTTASTIASTIRNDGNSVILNATPKTTTAFDNTDRVVGVIDNGSNVKDIINGVDGNNSNYTRSGVLTVNLFTLGGFSSNGTTSSWFVGRFYGHVIVNRVLTAPEIANLTTYLGAKMGLSL